MIIQWRHHKIWKNWKNILKIYVIFEELNYLLNENSAAAKKYSFRNIIIRFLVNSWATDEVQKLTKVEKIE